MSFDKFPLDEQRCMFRVGSYSYDSSKMVFIAKSIGYSSKQSNSIALDYEISKKRWWSFWVSSDRKTRGRRNSSGRENVNSLSLREDGVLCWAPPVQQLMNFTEIWEFLKKFRGQFSYHDGNFQCKIFLEIEPLKDEDKVLDYGSLGNFSLSGFEMVLTRYVSTYIITYYLPSGLSFFDVISNLQMLYLLENWIHLDYILFSSTFTFKVCLWSYPGSHFSFPWTSSREGWPSWSPCSWCWSTSSTQSPPTPPRLRVWLPLRPGCWPAFSLCLVL